MHTRRELLKSGAAVAGGAAMGTTQAAQAGSSDQEARSAEPYYLRYEDSHHWEASYSGGGVDQPAQPPGEPGKDYDPVVVPNGGKVPFKIVEGVKVFHLIVSEVDHEFASGLTARCWGYDGRINSSVIEAVEGDRVRIYVTNRLPAPTSVHWHGMYLPNGMDGVSGLTQPHIQPGETFKYEWTLRQHGTLMYHSHHDTMTQEGMGLIGMFVIHPRNPSPEHKVDRDFAIMLSEWAIEPGTARPNTLENSDFNILTMNGRCFPGTDPLVVKKGDRVRIRFGNLSQMDHHPIHLHGYHFRITATDGERIPLSAQWPETTVLVAVGQTREVELVADAPGDWAMHCHMTHHIMNQMGHDLPNMVGVKPKKLNRKIRSLLPGYMTMGETGMGKMGKMAEKGKMEVPENSIPMKGAEGSFGDYITMGGMFTIFRVVEETDDYENPGWYQPKGPVSLAASEEDLNRDGIDTEAKPSGLEEASNKAGEGPLARVDPISPRMKSYLQRWWGGSGSG